MKQKLSIFFTFMPWFSLDWGSLSYKVLGLNSNSLSLNKMKPSRLLYSLLLILALGTQSVYAQTGPGDDYDNDGIINSLDLDDDNDGILDIIESPCNLAPTFSSNWITANYNGANNVRGGTVNMTTSYYSGVMAFDGNAIRTGNGFAANPDLGQYTVAFDKPVSNVIIGNNYLEVAGEFITYEFSGVTGTLNVSLINNWSGAYITKLSATKWRVNTGQDCASCYSGLNMEVSGGFFTNIHVVGGGDYGSTWSRNSYFYLDDAVLQNSCTALNDVDGDGIDNSFDLDSDADGCPDAIEGGAKLPLSSLQASSIPGGSTNVTKNLGTTVGTTPTTNGVPIAVGTGQTVGFSQNSAVNACIDSDADEKADIYDLDDDNDGILDLDECKDLPVYNVYAYNRTSAAFSPNAPYTITGASAQNVEVSQVTAGTDLSYGGFNWKLLASYVVPDASNKISVALKPTSLTDGTYLIADAILITNGAKTYVLDNGGTPVGAWTGQNVAGAYAGNEWYSTTPHSGKIITWNFTSIPSGACDADGDGIPSYLDLDSDGDGCADAIEGGANFTQANLVNSALPGGTTNVTKNLGNTVGTTATTFGVPTIAGTGQTVGYSQNKTANACIDSDGDGISDLDDLDDDNDGILDTNEMNCNVAITPDPASTSYVNSGNWPGLNAPQLTSTTSWSAATAGVGPSTAQGQFVGMKFASPKRINAVTTTGRGDAPQWVTSYDLQATKDGTNWTTIGSYTGNTNQNTKVTNTVSNTENDWIGARIVPKTAVVHISLRFEFLVCDDTDTDNDGIPNSLDLDSDNDGCLDAIEGGATITLSQLVTAGGTVTVGTGSSAANQNLCGSATCVNAQGLPQLSPLPTGYNNTTGQTIGSSQNGATKDPECILACYNAPNTGSVGIDTKHGITLLQRAGGDKDSWPMINKSAHTVIESNTKGFVITRMKTTEITAIVSPQEGMMVYDTEAKCLKLYNGTAWSCFSSPACP